MLLLKGEERRIGVAPGGNRRKAREALRRFRAAELERHLLANPSCPARLVQCVSPLLAGR